VGTTQGSGVWIGRRTHKWTCAAIPNGNQSSILSASRLSDKTVQIFGTLGVGGSINIEGSNDGGTTWGILNDTRGKGNPLTFTALPVAPVTINENPEMIRANVTAGDGTSAFTVIIVSHTVTR
jgi:hypothetical protein